MAAAVIQVLTGTTAAWESVKEQAILEENEVAFEITEDGFCLVRQGDGAHKFFDLPVRINPKRIQEILNTTEQYMNVVETFKNNMTEATNSANSAAGKANAAATEATAAAKACEGVVDGLNTMVDTVTGTACVLTMENGLLTVREA